MRICECATNACKSVFLMNRRTAFVERALLPRNTSSGFKIDVLNSTPALHLKLSNDTSTQNAAVRPLR